MRFRANDAADLMAESARSYLLPQKSSDAQIRSARVRLEEILIDLGPVIERYPLWHPLVSNHDSREPTPVPEQRCGFLGLDHTVFFAHGFVTCPYGDGQSVINSVNSIEFDDLIRVSVEKLDVKLYHPDATPILITVRWNRPMLSDGTVPLRIALSLLLENQIQSWRSAQIAETWESMRPYILGVPHGSRSSLFVNQTTGQRLKNIWNDLISSGMFGPIRQ